MVDAMVAVLVAPTAEPARSRASGQAWSPPTSRREEILAHALALFRTRGFGGVGIDEVGEAAGISGPTVYFHYDSKVGILLDAFERAGTRVAAGVHDSLGVATSTADALDRLARSYLLVAMANVDLIVVTSREGGALPESERPRLARRRREIRDAWVAVARELRSDLSAAGARTLVAGVFPLMNQLAQQGGEVEESVGLARAFLLDGVSSEK
jgi:AcrR family transcriptional regulator